MLPASLIELELINRYSSLLGAYGRDIHNLIRVSCLNRAERTGSLALKPIVTNIYPFFAEHEVLAGIVITLACRRL
jgi:hypothetical protein